MNGAEVERRGAEIEGRGLGKRRRPLKDEEAVARDVRERKDDPNSGLSKRKRGQ